MRRAGIRKGKGIAIVAAAIAAITVVAVGFVSRDWLLDEWAIRNLGSPRPEVRQRAVIRLGDQRCERALPALIEASRNDPDSSVRVEAVRSLGKFGNGSLAAIDALVAARALDVLKQLCPLPEESFSKVEALEWTRSSGLLLESGPRGISRAVQVLIPALSDEDFRTRSQVAEKLASLGADAVPGLVGALGRSNHISVPAARILGQIGLPAVTALKEALSDMNPQVRRRAAEALGLIGPSAREAVRLLQFAADDVDEDVREEADAALARIRATDR